MYTITINAVGEIQIKDPVSGAVWTASEAQANKLAQAMPLSIIDKTAITTALSAAVAAAALKGP